MAVPTLKENRQNLRRSDLNYCLSNRVKLSTNCKFKTQEKNAPKNKADTLGRCCIDIAAAICNG